MITITIVLVFLIIIYYLFTQNDIVEGLRTFNGRMAIQTQYFYDKLFDDVVYYPNIYNKDYESGEEIGKLIKTGWIDCLEKCRGNCTEYGVNGVAYCFQQPTDDGKFI